MNEHVVFVCEKRWIMSKAKTRKKVSNGCVTVTGGTSTIISSFRKGAATPTTTTTSTTTATCIVQRSVRKVRNDPEPKSTVLTWGKVVIFGRGNEVIILVILIIAVVVVSLTARCSCTTTRGPATASTWLGS